MVVWSDERHNYCYRIYGARVTPSGVVLDPDGFEIGPQDSTFQFCPSVIFTGTRFFVVWGDVFSPSRVCGRFVEINGQLGDTVRIYDADGCPVIRTRVASDGTNFLVTWMQFTGEPTIIKGQLVSAGGVLIDSSFVIGRSSDYSTKGFLGLCYDGINYCVTWNDTAGILWGRKYNNRGVPVGQMFRISFSTRAQRYPYVISGANNRYLNVWAESINAENFDIYANLDIPITNIESSKPKTYQFISLKSSIVRDMIEVKNAEGIEVIIYDVLGCRLGATLNGRFNCQKLQNGVYYVRVATGESFKVIKIR